MNLAVVTNKPFENCETFVKAQINGLPFTIEHYWGRSFPFNVPVEKPKRGIKHKIKQKIKPEKRPSNLDFFCNHVSEKEIDVVLAQYGVMGAQVLPACKRLNLPLVVHFHGYDAVRKTTLRDYKEKYEQLFSYDKTTVIAVSIEMKKRLIAIGCPESKIVYNTYGPANEFLKLVPTHAKNQFVSIGRFVDKKAPHLAVLAFSKTLRTHPEATFVYAGDGPLMDSCVDLALALGIENSITFPGRITPDEYRDLLLSSIAYVQHSVEAQDGDMEGTPVSILEASGAGLAVISTVHAGIPDVIVHNETGLLCEERDFESMSKNMSWALENREAVIEMGHNGKERISSSYSIQHHLDGLAGIIKNAAQ